MHSLHRRLVVALTLLVALVAYGVPGARAASVPEWETVRIGGADRYATAAALSRHTFPEPVDEVVVASGEAFADALAATPTAARRGAPLLLTRRTTLPAATVEEIRRLRPSIIHLAGGTSAVNGGVERELSRLARVNRVAGADRFATSAALASMVFGTGVPVVFLAQGRNFPDALAAGAAAGRLGGPVLLVERDTIPESVYAALTHLRPSRIVLVGGPAAIGEGVRDALWPHGDIQRVGGADRYATAAALAEQVPGPSKVALVAAGGTFPDALAAGPSAAALAGTLALTTRGCLPTAAAQGMADDEVEEVVVVGGEAAVPTAAIEPCGPVVMPTTTTTSSSTTSTSTSTSTTTTSTTTTTTSTTSTTTPATTSTTAVRPTTTTSTTLPAAVTPSLSAVRSLPGDAPDPTVLRVGDRWFAYSTQFGLTKVPVRSSTDLSTWTAFTDAMPALPSWASFGSNWAPSAVVAEGKVVLWYTATDTDSGRQCISRAVADDPAGPFVDELPAAAKCQLDLGGSIDPFVFTDDDGSRYLYWKSDENALGKPSRLWAQRLSADGLTLSGSPAVVLSQGSTWEEPTIEQPAVVRKGNVYHLFYSGGWWESEGYGIGRATGTSPMGAFTKRSTTEAWFGGRTDALGPGALDVFVGPDELLWATYHAWPGPVGYSLGGERTMRLGRLTL